MASKNTSPLLSKKIGGEQGKIGKNRENQGKIEVKSGEKKILSGNRFKLGNYQACP